MHLCVHLCVHARVHVRVHVHTLPAACVPCPLTTGRESGTSRELGSQPFAGAAWWSPTDSAILWDRRGSVVMVGTGWEAGVGGAGMGEAGVEDGLGMGLG